MPSRRHVLRGFAILFLVAAAACGVTVGAGFGMTHPSPWQGPWGDDTFVGGPVYR